MLLQGGNECVEVDTWRHWWEYLADEGLNGYDRDVAIRGPELADAILGLCAHGAVFDGGRCDERS